jgi:FkbH-like protein
MNLNSAPLNVLVRSRMAMLRQLRRKTNLRDLRIAILGGSTTTEIADFAELFLLDMGLRPIFFQSGYNRYFEESVVDPSGVIEFRPEIAYVHTSSVNIQRSPHLSATEAELEACVASETDRFAQIWRSLATNVGCLVIQNNFELLPTRVQGNLDSVIPGGQTRFINCLNVAIGREANLHSKVFINDLNFIAASVGLSQFHDMKRWFGYKLITSPEASVQLAKSLCTMIGSVYGLSRKCLVLDLDDTLWGGAIGDVGPEKIRIGRGSAEGEAFAAMQEYCLKLKNRGILLAVCSKNSEEVARQGFEHPETVLRISDFASFKANWNPKHDNIQEIARELNLGLESLVFLDDNPSERELVAAQLPAVAVADVGADVADFPRLLDQQGYFEPVMLSREDLNRAQLYRSNAQRDQQGARFDSYSDFLDSLEMTAEIREFGPAYLDRICQLINKTNQFNLTGTRLTSAGVETIAKDPEYVKLFGRLSDKFGDHGLVSVIIGRLVGSAVHIDVWVMSCRVIKRDMEFAMFDALVAACQRKGVTRIYGYYKPSTRNNIVKDLYERLGFSSASETEDGVMVWEFESDCNYIHQNIHIGDFAHERSHAES